MSLTIGDGVFAIRDVEGDGEYAIIKYLTIYINETDGMENKRISHTAWIELSQNGIL